MSHLFEIIAAELERTKTISFERFMELALYCPEYGYYEKEGDNIGRGGDFQTSVTVGTLFGELLGARIAQWLRDLSGQNVQPILLETGAHRADLAGDILRFFQAHEAALFATLEYWIVEPSPRRREWQRKTLEPFLGQVRWLDDLPSQPFVGVILSNELLDAMPVRRLGWDAAQRHWFEFGVGLENGRLVWSRLPGVVATPVAFPEAVMSVLPDGFSVEICPRAEEWWSRAARCLQKGWLLTCDYGLETLEFFTPDRPEGTLRSYYRHQQVKDVLARPGEQDITSQVNFTRLRELGESEGVITHYDDTQERFLVEILREIEAGKLNFPAWSPRRIRQLQTLIHPQYFGRAFRVLVQSR